MVQGIIDSLSQEKCLRREHLTVLLQENMINLDFSKAGPAAWNDSLLRTIQWRCPVGDFSLK